MKMMKTAMAAAAIALALGSVTSVSMAQTGEQEASKMHADMARMTTAIARLVMEDSFNQVLIKATFAAQERQAAVDRGATALELEIGDAYRTAAGFSAGRATNFELDAAIDEWCADHAWETASLAWIAEAYASAKVNFDIAFTEYNTSSAAYLRSMSEWDDAAKRFVFAGVLYIQIQPLPPMPPMP